MSRPGTPDWRRAARAIVDIASFRLEDETSVVEEVAQHLEDRYDYLRSRGWSAQAAAGRVLDEFEADRSGPGASGVLADP